MHGESNHRVWSFGPPLKRGARGLLLWFQILVVVANGAFNAENSNL